MADLQELAAALLGEQTQAAIKAENPYYRLQAVPTEVGNMAVKLVASNPDRYSTKDAMIASIGSGLLSGLLGGMGDDYQNTLTDRYTNVVVGKEPGGDLPKGLFSQADRTHKLWALSNEIEGAQKIRDAKLKTRESYLSDPVKMAQLREMDPALAAELGLGASAGEPTAPAVPSLNNPMVKTREDAVDSLRKEFNALPEVKNFSIIQSKAQPLAKALSDPGRVSDQELVRYSLLMIEPTSVVRDGEQAAMANSQSIPRSWMGQLSGALNGETTLGPDVREGIRRLAMRAYEGHKSLYDKAVSFYGNEAKLKGLDPQRVSPLGDAPTAESIFGSADQQQLQTSDLAAFIVSAKQQGLSKEEAKQLWNQLGNSNGRVR